MLLDLVCLVSSLELDNVTHARSFPYKLFMIVAIGLDTVLGRFPRNNLRY